MSRNEVSGYFKIFPTRLRKLMEEKKLTQDDIGAAIGKTRQSVSKYMNGLTSPTWEDIVIMAKLFKVPTDYLLGMPGSIPNPDLDTQAVCRLLGVNEDTVSAISYLSRGFPNIINQLFQSTQFLVLIQSIAFLRRSCVDAALHCDSLKDFLDLDEQDLEEVSKLPKRNMIQYRNELRNNAYDIVENATGLADALTAYRSIKEAVERDISENIRRYSGWLDSI